VGSLGGRKRALGTRRPLAPPPRPDECLSLDFIRDAFNRRPRVRVLAEVDDFTRGRLCRVADTLRPRARLARQRRTLPPRLAFRQLNTTTSG